MNIVSRQKFYKILLFAQLPALAAEPAACGLQFRKTFHLYAALMKEVMGGMGQEKMTKKPEDWRNFPGYCVNCVKCGKMYSKGFSMESASCCPRCGFSEFTFLENSMRVQLPAELLSRNHAKERIEAICRNLRLMYAEPPVS